MVHAADWTPAMLARCTGADGAVNYEALLRSFGYGVPEFNRLMSSADNSLTLIAQGVIQPFFKEDGTVKTREMRLHALPWQIDILRDRSEEHTSELQSLMRIQYAVFCLKKKR